MWTVIGHDSVVSYFEKALATGRLGHAYLLVGPSGVGKGTLAVNLAQAVNCHGIVRPCNSCSQCTRIFKGNHPDVRIIEVDRVAERKMIGLNSIREIQQESFLEPFEGRCRVYIVDEAEKLSDEAANRFLKLLEEPPPRVIFLLLTNDCDLLPLTIVSRCCRIDLRPLAESVVSQILQDQFMKSEWDTSLLAKLSGGRLGWAIRAQKNPQILETWFDLSNRFSKLMKANIPERLEFSQYLVTSYTKQPWVVQEILDWWMFWWWNVLLKHMNLSELSGYPEGFLGIELQEGFYLPMQSLHYIKAIKHTSRLLELNVNPRLALDSLVLALPGPT